MGGSIYQTLINTSWRLLSVKIKLFWNPLGTKIWNPDGYSLAVVIWRKCLNLIYTHTHRGHDNGPINFSFSWHPVNTCLAHKIKSCTYRCTYQWTYWGSQTSSSPASHQTFHPSNKISPVTNSVREKCCAIFLPWVWLLSNLLSRISKGGWNSYHIEDLYIYNNANKKKKKRTRY